MRKRKNNNQVDLDASIPTSNVLDLRKIVEQKSGSNIKKIKKSKNDRVMFWKKVSKDISREKDKKEKKRKKEIIKQRILKEKVRTEKENHRNLLKEDLTKRKEELKKTKRIKKENTKKAKIQKKSIFRRRQIQKESEPVEHWLLKNAITFVIIALVLVFPIFTFGIMKDTFSIKDRIVDLANSAYLDLLRASEEVSDFDVNGINNDLDSAVNNFTTAQEELDNLNIVAVSLAKIYPPTRKQLSSAENLLEAGNNIAKAGQSITSATQVMAELDKNNINGFTDKISISKGHLLSAIINLEQAEVAIKKVDINSVSEEQRDKVLFLVQVLPTINKSFGEFNDLINGMLEILGHEQKKRYLLLFQNNQEIRPTGGFIGSIALIDISKGRVENIEIPSGGAYDMKGQLKEKVISPEPMHLVNPHWQLQDANWWPDFPTSARKIMWFYEKSGGPTVDGVITFTPTVIENLLEATGPIDMIEDYGQMVTSDNFVDFAQAETEKDRINEPKKFIADLAPMLLNRLFEKENASLFSILNVFSKGLSEKHILLYFEDEGLEQKMKELGWAGEIKQTSGDFLSVINTNISGGKTDGVIEQIIEHDSEIRSDGSIVNTVKVTRIHKGETGEKYEGENNINYIRFYVPNNSILIEASGFTELNNKLFFDPEIGYKYDKDLEIIEKSTIIDAYSDTRIYSLFDKTVFGNWIETRPGETSEVWIKYTLPIKIDLTNWNNKYDSYSLLVQKQPGSIDSLFYSSVSWPKELQASWIYPQDGSIVVENDSIGLETVLNYDTFFAVVLKSE